MSSVSTVWPTKEPLQANTNTYTRNKVACISWCVLHPVLCVQCSRSAAVSSPGSSYFTWCGCPSCSWDTSCSLARSTPCSTGWLMVTPTWVSHCPHYHLWSRYSLTSFSCFPKSSVSQYTNAFAITQLCAILCAPWNGLIMDRHKKKPLAPGKSVNAVRTTCFHVETPSESLLYCRRDWARGGPALLLPVPAPDCPAVPHLFCVYLYWLSPAAVLHLHPAGPQSLLPLWGECSLH